MHGSLAHHNGVLYVGRYAKTAWIRSFDLDGGPLETSFSFRDEAAGRSSIDGLAVDDDHRVWVADGAARRVRAFTLFGHEVAHVADEPANGEADDARGRIGVPAGIAVAEADDELVVAVASSGQRRHALHLLYPGTGRSRSIRPCGNPRGQFHGLRGLALVDDWLYACEGGSRRVQVFRDGEHHFDFACAPADDRAAVPVAIDVLPDRRAVVAVAGETSALLLVDPGGRLMRVLACEVESPHAEGGTVDQPGDVVIAAGSDDRHTRVAVIDRAGDRVQVFNLEGRCYGAFPSLAPATPGLNHGG